MKRRDFLKKTVVASTAVIVTGASILGATKKTGKIGTVYAPYIPLTINTTFGTLPKLQPGDIGIIYGKTGSGKSKVIYEMWSTDMRSKNIKHPAYLLVDLEVNPDMRVFENLEIILRDYPRKNIYIDNFNMVDDRIKTYHRLRDLQKIAVENKSKIWVTLQQNRTAVEDRFNVYEINPFQADMSQPIMSISTSIIHVRHENGHIYGDIIKNRYGTNGMIYFGKAKYLGAKNV